MTENFYAGRAAILPRLGPLSLMGSILGGSQVEETCGRYGSRPTSTAGGSMATLFPDLESLGQLVSPLNAGELKVARILRDQLDDSWTVYVQPRLTMHVPDFVVVHPHHGVHVIEVKDWKLGHYRIGPNGKIQYRNGSGWQPTNENPRYQAYRYLSMIRAQFFGAPEKNCVGPVRATVILLNYSTKDARQLLDDKLAPVAQREISVIGDDDLRGVAATLCGHSVQGPDAESLERFRRNITVSSIMPTLSEELVLSAGAQNVATNPSNARIRRVRGPAGCGKSFGVAARAARLASEGKSVLVLSFTATLVHYLRGLVNVHSATYAANPTRVTCTHFHAFCARVAEDATRDGLQLVVPTGTPPHDVSVVKAMSAFDQGWRCRYDAVLVDEGQDFTLEWWNMLRRFVVEPDGEMLFVTDPTQNIFGVPPGQGVSGAGFNGQWTDLRGSYRLPADMVRVAAAYVQSFIDGPTVTTSIPDDRDLIAGRSAPTVRDWKNGVPKAKLGHAIGEAVVELLATHTDLAPSEVVFLCETHQQGLDAVKVLEAHGHEVHHIFGADQITKQRRKAAFWLDAPGVKGCTTWSFKGWEARAVILGVGTDPISRQLAYVAMTRVKADRLGRAGFVTVINSDHKLDHFAETFMLAPESWPPPSADGLVV